MKRIIAASMLLTLLGGCAKQVQPPVPGARTVVYESGSAMVIIDPAVVESILASDLPADQKRQALERYLQTIDAMTAKVLARSEVHGNNITRIMLTVITSGMAIYGALK